MKISGYYLEATYADNIPLDKRPYFIERYLVSSRIYLAKGEIWIWVDKKKAMDLFPHKPPTANQENKHIIAQKIMICFSSPLK